MRIISRSLSDTLRIGRVMAKELRQGDIICLSGELGSGKTVLTKGIASGLGVAAGKIISPTFVIIREYSGKKFPLYHFDLYRLGAARDITALGYEEYFYGNGVSVIEWAEKLKYLLPEEYLGVELSIKNNPRRLLDFTAYGRHYAELLRRIQKNLEEDQRVTFDHAGS